MNELIVVEFNGEDRIDSRVVDKVLGIEHKSFMETIRKYQERLERRGLLPFQQAKTTDDERGRGRPETYVLLNEGQSLFASTLSRNTEEVVDFKDALVTAFLEARKKQFLPKEDINAAFRFRRDENKWLAEPLRFTVEEKTSVIALQGHLQGLEFADNAFLDNSLGQGFKPWCEEKNYDMSLARQTEKPRLVGWELKKDGSGEYDFTLPTHVKVYSYPEDPFGLAWTIYLVECYWPQKFLPYITRKYKGEERVKNTQSGIKVISLFTGLTYDQITARK